MDIVSSSKNIESTENKMLKMEQAECPVVHTFGPGLYIREVTMPKGALAIGHHQIFDQMNVFLRGKIVMVSNDGSKIELSAPMMFTGKPGRKMGYVLEEVVWLNIYPTEERDIETLESTYLRKSDTWLNQPDQPDRPDQLDQSKEKHGYTKMLTELGVTEEEVRLQSEEKKDQIPLPYGSYKIGIFQSNIEGKGVFATANIKIEEIIAPARIEGKRTPVGRYTNHSDRPNAKMTLIGNNIFLVATKEITGCKGGQYGEEITTNYRRNIKVIRSMLCQQ